MLAGLARGEVAARAVALGTRERGLDQQHVGVAGEPHQLVVGAAVGAVGEPAAVAGQLDGEGGDVVRDLAEAHGQRAQLTARRRPSYSCTSNARRRSGLVAPAADDAAQHLAAAGRQRTAAAAPGCSSPASRATGTGCWRGA